MTKKDFIRLADYIRHLNFTGDNYQYLKAICEFCKASNPLFNQDIFIGYLNGTCGPSGGKR